MLVERTAQLPDTPPAGAPPGPTGRSGRGPGRTAPERPPTPAPRPPAPAGSVGRPDTAPARTRRWRPPSGRPACRPDRALTPPRARPAPAGAPVGDGRPARPPRRFQVARSRGCATVGAAACAPCWELGGRAVGLGLGLDDPRLVGRPGVGSLGAVAAGRPGHGVAPHFRRRRALVRVALERSSASPGYAAPLHARGPAAERRLAVPEPSRQRAQRAGDAVGLAMRAGADGHTPVAAWAEPAIPGRRDAGLSSRVAGPRVGAGRPGHTGPRCGAAIGPTGRARGAGVATGS